MKFSLNILERWFQNCRVKTFSSINNEEASIVTVKISTTPMPSNIGRICAAQAVNADPIYQNSTAITTGQDYLILIDLPEDETLLTAQEALKYYNTWESTLFHKMTADTSLQELLELGHMAIKRPMSICNSKGWDYAMTDGHGHYIHPTREEFRYSDDKNKDSADRLPFMNCLNELLPVMIYSPPHKSNVLLSNIWLRGERAGAIIAYEDGMPFTGCDIHLMQIFQNIITIYATINNNVLRSRSALSEYLMATLDRKPLQKYNINKILKYPNWKPGDEYMVLCIHAKTPTNTNALNSLCDKLEKATFHPQSFVYNDKVVSLINMKCCLSREQLLRELENFISPDEYYWGISHEFTGITHFRDYYKQSCYALQQAELANTPFKTMREVARNCIQENIAENQWVQTLIHPDVPRLVNYDINNRSQYSNTLYWFLFYSCNYTDAANQLNLHRNTLIYRIHKIQEIITVDFMDPHERELMILSFLLYRYVTVGNLPTQK